MILLCLYFSHCIIHPSNSQVLGTGNVTGNVTSNVGFILTIEKPSVKFSGLPSNHYFSSIILKLLAGAGFFEDFKSDHLTAFCWPQEWKFVDSPSNAAAAVRQVEDGAVREARHQVWLIFAFFVSLFELIPRHELFPLFSSCAHPMDISFLIKKETH